MLGKYGPAAVCAIFVVACVQLAVSDLVPAETKNSALGVVRLVKAAEKNYFHANGRYATFPELIQSRQLAQTATASTENLRAYFTLKLESESETVPGFKFGLDVGADGATYKLSIERPGNCWSGFHTDEKDAVFEDKVNDCASGAATEDTSEEWVPPDIGHALLPAHPEVACPLPEILESTSRRALELEDNLQRFTARELIEHLEIGKNGKRRSSTTSIFNYVAEIFESGGGAYINEYRSEARAAEGPHVPLADTGTAAFALLFLPHNRDEFSMTCEGYTELDTRPVWQLHFIQRSDRVNDFRGYRIDNRMYPVNIKGRAWVAADTFEVLRLESDLVEPIKEINLQKEHLTIEYAPVAFPKRDARLWLPDNVTLYIEYRGHRYERRHRFSEFQLFSVDTVQQTKAPSLDKDAQNKKD